jgi:predicted cation transporter
MLLILGIIRKLVSNNKSPLLRHIIAKIFNKYFYFIRFLSVILQNAAIAGHQGRQFANLGKCLGIGM